MPDSDLRFLSFTKPRNSFTEENAIDRRMLVDIAPDREDLIMSEKSIEELREMLKLRDAPSAIGWLYMHACRQDVRKLRNKPDRTSTFLRSINSKGEHDGDGSRTLQIVRRASCDMLQPLLAITDLGNQDTLSWGGVNLSTRDVLISPRPLGVTHILVLVQDGSNAMAHSTGYPTIIDQPINDLLFTLNAPNLASGSLLPRRLHKELPKVGVHVPHLITFPEMVVYLHTKNQAELFRKVVPEFIRDLMHPLCTPRFPLPVSIRERKGSFASQSGSDATSIKTVSKRLLWPFLASGRTETTFIPTSPTSSHFNTSVLPLPDVDSIAKDIVAAARLRTEDDLLVHVATALDALRDNLLFIGYLEQGLWAELETCRQVLLRAVGLEAALAKA
ncbi:hypothetical protein VNI00_004321 [Paramarasmius palmivorus]|uniref:Uncharacterized protein n=1 Tax=Paramarasmius palmivorus TaxID=297713 RepID=A0AAW0DPN6_9AGAR